MRSQDRLNVYLEADQRAALRALAERTGEHESRLVRMAVTYLLRNSDFFVPPVSREARLAVSRESAPAAIA